MTQDEAKALVGRRAVEFVEDGMAVGLGTGTTSVMFIRALGERGKAGLKIRCVASSDASTTLGKSLLSAVSIKGRASSSPRCTAAWSATSCWRGRVGRGP